ncbi:Uncharacterized protein conserved in bacteria [Leminorella richardii]|uniref:Uncharacterized protein conserved in bacteria n=1 Tax=Leminorella richardii TaxID=158841 RepID=A0A2X4Y5J1_9GAMM|nr:type VI secretion system protein TssL, short form [Leminorella richardii]SQI43804.1 Uncharacterized protein conserved in bacteria [Leminorella richardii]
MSQSSQTVSIDELLRDVALTVVHLRAGAVVEKGEALYKRCVDQITTLRQRLTEMQYDATVIDDVSYAACALLDETVLQRSNDEGYEVWQGVPLQVTFFNTYQAGDILYERIRERIRHPEGSQLVLACYDRVLGLGFQGRYQSQPQGEREALVMAVRDLLPAAQNPGGGGLMNAFSARTGLWRGTSLLFWTGVSLVAVVALYFALRYHIDSLLAQLLQGA